LALKVLIVALVAVLAGSLVGTSAATAARKAKPAEREAIAWVVGIPARCSVVEISTAARGWGLLYSRGLRSCPGASGFVVLQRRYGQWRIQYQGAGTDQSPCRVVRPVPARVGLDFGICAG